MAVERQLDPASLVARIVAELQANPEAQRLLLRTLWTNEFFGIPACLFRIEKDVAELKADVAPHDAGGSRHDADASLFKYVAWEDRLHRMLRSLAKQAYDIRMPRVVQSWLQETDRDFEHRVGEAVADGRITHAQEHRIYCTHLVMRAQRIDETPVWVAVEASNRVQAGDIGRARASANALQAVFDVDALPVVAGFGIDARDAQRAEATRVRYVEASPPEW